MTWQFADDTSSDAKISSHVRAKWNVAPLIPYLASEQCHGVSGLTLVDVANN